MLELSVALSYAWDTGRVLTFRNPDHWNYGGIECSAGWECYFRYRRYRPAIASSVAAHTTITGHRLIDGSLE